MQHKHVQTHSSKVIGSSCDIVEITIGRLASANLAAFCVRLNGPSNRFFMAVHEVSEDKVDIVRVRAEKDRNPSVRLEDKDTQLLWCMTQRPDEEPIYLFTRAFQAELMTVRSLLS